MGFISGLFFGVVGGYLCSRIQVRNLQIELLEERRARDVARRYSGMTGECGSA